MVKQIERYTASLEFQGHSEIPLYSYLNRQKLRCLLAKIKVLTKPSVGEDVSDSEILPAAGEGDKLMYLLWKTGINLRS